MTEIRKYKIMINLEYLEHSWTAKVKLFNGVVITLWYTAWPMSKHTVKEVLSVASDYPRSFVNRELI